VTTVKIDGPDGKTYRVDVPVGMDPESVVDQFGADMGWSPTKPVRFPAPAASKEADLGDKIAILGAGFIRGGNNAMNPALLASGLSRLGQGVLKTLPGPLSNITQKGADDLTATLEEASKKTQGADIALSMPGVSNFAAAMKTAGADPAKAPRSAQQAAKERGVTLTPELQFLANIAEGVGGALPLAPLGLPAALGYGALSGVGAGVGEVVGGETGKFIGSLAPALVAPGVNLARYGARVTEQMRPAGQRAVAERIVRESANDPTHAAATLGRPQPTIPNAGFTGAEMSGDRGLLSLQRAYMQRPGAVVGGEYAGSNIPDAFLAARAQQNAALGRSLNRMGAGASTDDASVALARSMRERTYEPVLRDETRAWDAFRQTSGNQVFDADPLHRAWNALRRQPNVRPDRDLVPSREYKKLQSVFERGAADLDEIQSIRSGLNDAVRAAEKAGERNRARVIREHRQVLDNYIDNLPVRDPTTLDLYQRARGITRAKKTAFDDSRVGTVFERTGARYDLEASRVAKEAFKSRESLSDALRLSRANPEILSHLRRNFATRLLDYARTSRTELATGDRVLSRASIQNFLDDPVNQYARQQLYGSEAGRRVWGRIEDAVRRMDATDAAKPRVGSNTSYDVQRGALLDGILMRWTGNLSGGVGPTIINRFTKALLNSSIQEIDGMVAAILLNPSATRLALSRPTPANLNLLRSISFRSPLPGALAAGAGAARTSQGE
jgi:hypothetical protein